MTSRLARGGNSTSIHGMADWRESATITYRVLYVPIYRRGETQLTYVTRWKYGIGVLKPASFTS